MLPPAIDASASDGARGFPRDVFDFLVESAVASNRLASYPSSHPAAASAAQVVHSRLSKVLEHREILAIGITREGFVVDEVPSDTRQRLLRTLARKLHEEQIGAMTFARGVSEDEVRHVLARIVSGASAEGTPLGLAGDEELTWKHARLSPIAYERLQLSNDITGTALDELSLASEGKALWLRLAGIAMGVADPASADAPLSRQEIEAAARMELPSPGSVAGALREAASGTAPGAQRRRAVTGVLLRLTEESRRQTQGHEVDSIRDYLSDLIGTLSTETLEQLMEMEGDVDLRRKFIFAASQGLATSAVVSLARAAANASKVAVSSPLLRVLEKLAADAAPGSDADSSVRSLVRQTVATWSSGDGAPPEYTGLLDQMSLGTPEVSGLRGSFPVAPEAVVYLGLEAGVANAVVFAAAERMISEGGTNAFVDALQAEQDHNISTVQEIREQVLRPDLLFVLLRGSQVDYAAIDRLIPEMGVAASEPLLDVLSTSEDRALRSRLLTILASMGSDVGPRLVTRLAGAPWFVQRNLLELLGRMAEVPPGVSLSSYARNTDSRVRRAALKVMFRLPGHRDDGLLIALEDKDEDVLRLALAAAVEGCPPAAVPVVRKRYERDVHADDMRAMCVRLLATRRDPAMLQRLISLAIVPRKFLRRERLKDKSAEMLAAVAALAQYWSHDSTAAGILRVAAASADADVRNAARYREAQS